MKVFWMPMVGRCTINMALALPIMAAGPPPLAIPKPLSALCPKPKSGEITVCAVQEPAPSPYRAPFKSGPVVGSRNSVSVGRERNALVEMGMDGGAGSCSASGAMGMYGCSFGDHKHRAEQRAGSKDPRGRVFEGADK